MYAKFRMQNDHKQGYKFSIKQMLLNFAMKLGTRYRVNFKNSLLFRGKILSVVQRNKVCHVIGQVYPVW